MSDTLPLFDEPLGELEHSPPTSPHDPPKSAPPLSTAKGTRLATDRIAALPTRAPARSIDGHAPALRGRVLDYITSCGNAGATDKEIPATLNLSSDTELPRRWELVRAGQVEDGGTTRPTPSRRRAIVWVVMGVTA